MAKVKKTNGDLNFKAKLWQAADKMRNNMDAAEYKHVVLGLIFLKYISDAFGELYQKLSATKGADAEDADEYRAENVFYVPKKARWEFLQKNAKQPTIGKLIDDAMDEIEKDNATLKGVLPKNYARPTLDKQRLGELIDLIGTIGLGDKENRSKDILGRVYEYFLGQFADAEGKKGGQFYTPRSIVSLLVEMLEPYKGRVFDPCCGSGGMFVQGEKFVQVHGGRIGDIAVYGQESNQTTWRLCKMNLAIRGIAKQASAKWGEGFLAQLSKDLMSEFPDMKGFSERNLKYIRQWFLFYSKNKAIGQQPVAQITQIPWGHNIAIISKCKNIKEALFYIQNTLRHNWSRDVLVHQIESGLYKREGKSITNFSLTLPKPQSDLAQQTLKNPYTFDFLSMRKDYDEHDLEISLISHVTQFLLELGAGFSFLGRQVLVQVGVKEFFIDLLFYHTRLHCYVVVELKTGDFEPANAGQLNFYIKAIDSQLRKDGDNPTIGLLLCKSRDKLVAEYALSDIYKPIGVSEYKLTHKLPKKLKSSLPTIEEIEAELSSDKDKDNRNE